MTVDDLSDIEAPKLSRRDQGEVGRVRRSVATTKALRLRLAGFTYVEIAESLGGIDPSKVADLVHQALSEAEASAVADLRKVENLRLDKAQTAIWPGVLRGDLEAVRAWLRISQRRSTLNGLDAPKQVTISTNVQVEVEHALAELEEILTAEVVSDTGLVPDPDPAGMPREIEP